MRRSFRNDGDLLPLTTETDTDLLKTRDDVDLAGLTPPSESLRDTLMLRPEGHTVCLSRRSLTALEGATHAVGDGTMRDLTTSDRGTILPLGAPTDMLDERDLADTRAIPTACPSRLTVSTRLEETVGS